MSRFDRIMSMPYPEPVAVYEAERLKELADAVQQASLDLNSAARKRDDIQGYLLEALHTVERRKQDYERALTRLTDYAEGKEPGE